jgi:hypothetical protein
MSCTEGFVGQQVMGGGPVTVFAGYVHQTLPRPCAQALILPATLCCLAAQQLFGVFARQTRRPRIPGPSLRNWGSTPDLPSLEDQLPAGAWVEREP